MSLTVLQIIPALGTGGAERTMGEIARALIARGDKALAVSSGGRLVPELQAMGAQHITRDVKTKNPVKMVRNALWLAEIIRKEKVDIVHARSRAPAWSAWLACRLTGAHYVTTFHAAYNFKGGVKRAYNAVMAKGERVIAISPFIAAHIKENYPTAARFVRLINRGVDPAAFDPASLPSERLEAARRALGARQDVPVVLLPGRLSPIKGQSVALRALGILARKGFAPMPQLLIVGDDQGRSAYTAELKALIRELGVEPYVRLTGAWGDMAAAYALAQLVLVPSQVPEGFGRVPIEAMATGVPVIVSGTGAMKDTVLDGKTGWLVTPDAPEAWAEAIEAALSDASRLQAMGQAGRLHVQNSYTQSRMVAGTLALYDEVAGGALG